MVMFSDRDPFHSSKSDFFKDLIKSAKDQPNTIIRGAGHFLQEDKGEEIATNILGFIQRTWHAT